MAKEITVEAEIKLTSPAGEETVRSFDRAWSRANELKRPVRIEFVDFVRKD